jgi:hypothetical protein
MARDILLKIKEIESEIDFLYYEWNGMNCMLVIDAFSSEYIVNTPNDMERYIRK